MSGFVYLWRDRKHNRYYIGSHWGKEDDGYICSSQWMRSAYNRRPQDFKRRIIARVASNRLDLLGEEGRWLGMIKDHEFAPSLSTQDARDKTLRYYNICKVVKTPWHAYDSSERKLSIGEKISKTKTGKKTGPCSPERARNISEGKKGAKFTAEHKAKLAAAKTGAKRSEEAKRKTSESLKRAYAEGRRRTNVIVPQSHTRRNPNRCISSFSE